MTISDLKEYMFNLGFENKEIKSFIDKQIKNNSIKSIYVDELTENLYNSLREKVLNLFKDKVEDVCFIKQLNNNTYDEEILDIIELSQVVNKFESLGYSGQYSNCIWFDVGLIDGTSINVYWNRE